MMEYDEEEIIELSEEEVFDDDDGEWVEEEPHHSERNLAAGRGNANQQDDNFGDQEDDVVEEEEFVDEEYDEEVEEVWDEDDALSDEQFLNQLHKSFQEMAKKQNHHSSTRSNSLASIKEEETAFAEDANGSNDTGSFSVDESASVDFDLGSYQDDMSESSHDEPSDYEQACRNLIDMVYQGESVDADDIIRRCDLKNLYKNLKQQHRHLLKSKSQKDAEDSPWESFNQEVTRFPSNPTTTVTSKPPEDWIFDDVNDLWGFKSVQNSVPPTENTSFIEANRLPKAAHKSDFTEVVNETTLHKDDFISHDTTKQQQESNPRQVEKWLERDADDPDDYEYACRTLIAILYKDDEDHDADTMLRRSQPKDLYKYLKNEYWFLEHTGLIDQKLAAKGVETVTDRAPRLQDMIRSIKRDSTVQAASLCTEGGGNQLRDDVEAAEKENMEKSDEDADSRSNEMNVLVKPGPKVEKWFERNADDPKDFEVACRKLALILYRDDGDYDVNTMLRRTSPEDLYRYLSNEYWYQVRKGDLVSVDLEAIRVEDKKTPAQDKPQETFTALEHQLSARIPKAATETDQQNSLQLIMGLGIDKAGDLSSVVSSKCIEDVPYVRCGSSDSVEKIDERGEFTVSPHTSANAITWPPEVPENSGHDLSQQGASWNTLDVGTTNDDSSVESTGIHQQSWSDMYEQALGDGASVREVTRSLLDPSMSNHDSVEHSIDDETESLSDDISMPDTIKETEDMRDGDNKYGENMNQKSSDSGDQTLENALNWEVVRGSASNCSGNRQDNIESPSQTTMPSFIMNPKVSVYDLDFAKRLEIIKEEMLLLIGEAEIEELDESFEQSAVNALVLAAQKVAYRKKYFDVFSDRFIFFPPIAKTIMDYTLFDMIEQETSDELDCLPAIYSAALRSIANKHLAILQLDFDYMDKLGILIEEIVGGPLDYRDDESNANCIAAESNSQDSASTTMSQNDGETFEEDKAFTRLFHDESDDIEPGSFPSSVTNAKGIDAEARAKEMEGPPSFEQPRAEAEDHDDSVRGPGTEGTVESLSVATRHDSSSTRFREMSQILEFKRRIDKARLSEEADSLQKMRVDLEAFLLEGKKRLEEERNMARQEIEDSAKLLEKKHNSDVEEIQRKLEGLKATQQTAEQEIKSRFEELEGKRKNFVKQPASASNAKRLSEQVNLSQKQEEVLKRLLAAQLALETEREAAEGLLLESGGGDQGKAIGLFGVFGQRKRNLELEKQKQRQTNLMQWKLREIELEKEIMDAKSEQAALVEQIRQLECGSKELDFEIEQRRKSLEQEILIEEQNLLELSKAIEQKFVEGETKLVALKDDLELTYSQDIAWVSSELNAIESKYNNGRKQLGEEEKRQRERLIEEEKKINATALALKEKWLREEMALAKESEHEDFLDQRSVVLHLEIDRLEYSPSVEEKIHNIHQKFQNHRDKHSDDRNKEQILDEVAVYETNHKEGQELGTWQDEQGAKVSDDEIVGILDMNVQQEYSDSENEPLDHESSQNDKGVAEIKVHGGLPADSFQVDEVRTVDVGRVAAEIPQDSYLEAGRKDNEECEGDKAAAGSSDFLGENLFLSVQDQLLLREKQAKNTPNQNGQSEESISTDIEDDDRVVSKACEIDGHSFTNVDKSQLSEQESMWEGVKHQPLDSRTEDEDEDSRQAETKLVSQRVSLHGEILNGDDGDNMSETKGGHNGNVVDGEVWHRAPLEQAEFYYGIEDKESSELQKARITTSSISKEIDSVEGAAVYSKSKTTHEEFGIYNVGAANVIYEVRNATVPQKVSRMSGASAEVEQLEVDQGDDAGTTSARDCDAIEVFDEESQSRSSDDESTVDSDIQNQDVAMDNGELKQLEQEGIETKHDRLQGDDADDCHVQTCGQELDLFQFQPIKRLDDRIDVVASSDTHHSRIGEMGENRVLDAELLLGEDQFDEQTTTWNVDFNDGDGDDVCRIDVRSNMGMSSSSALNDDDAWQLQEEKPTVMTLSHQAKYLESNASDVFKTNDDGSVFPSSSTREGHQHLDGATLDENRVLAKFVEKEAHDETGRVAGADGYDCEEEGSEVKLRIEDTPQLKLQTEDSALVDVTLASWGVGASGEKEENASLTGVLTHSREDTTIYADQDDGIDGEVQVTALSDDGQAFDRIQNSSLNGLSEIGEHHETRTERDDLSSSATSFSVSLVTSSVGPKPAHTLESPTSNRYIGATHKRKHKPGGGLAGRLLEEAQHFLESSSGSFSQNFAVLAHVDSQHVDSFNDPVVNEDRDPSLQTGPSSPMSPSAVPSNQKVLFLLSRTATTRAQETQQDRALMLLKTLGVDLEVVDGSDLSRKALRETLFEQSGLRGVYPQIFVQTINGENVFFGGFAEIESANETGQLAKCLETCSSTTHENRQLALDRPQDATQETMYQHSTGLTSQVEGNSNNNRKSSEQATHRLQPLLVGNESPGAVIKEIDSSLIDVGSTNKSKSVTMAEPVGIEGEYNPNLAQEMTSESLFRDSWPVTRLEWWRQNGKRLVDEKLTTSTQAHGENLVGRNSSSTSSSLVEKRRLIAQRRQRALLARAQIAAPSTGYEHGGNAGGKDEETHGKQKEVEVEDVGPVGRTVDTNFPRQSKSLDTIRTSVTISTLDEKRRKAAEARARAMAARSSPRASSLMSLKGTRADKSNEKVVGLTTAQLLAHAAPNLSDQSGVDVKRAERMAEARRLSLNSARAREARLAREAQLLAKKQQGTVVRADDQRQEGIVETENWRSGVAPLTTEVTPRDASISSLLPQMIREADRLSTFIVRYEKKLETVCRSILAFAQQLEGDEEAENVQKSTLPDMYHFLSRRDWFRRHSTTEEAPRLFLATSNGNVESLEQRRAFSVDTCLQLTPLGSSFLAMDGQQESEFGRFLLSIRGSEHKMNELRQHWTDLAHRKPVDSLAEKIEGRLKELVAFGLDARLITAKES